MITPHFHICAFFDSREDACQVLAPFYREAEQNNERNLHLIEPGGLDEHRARLVGAGIDVVACEHRGQLALWPWPQASGALDVEALLAAMALATSAQGGAQAGFDGLRVMSQMGWAVRHGFDRLDLLEYEARLNGVLDTNRRLAICVYDLAPLDGATMMDLLRTHPLTMIGGVLRENPFFTPPAEMLRELSARRATGRRRARSAPVALPVPARHRRAE
ncbi:MEDS domain-containing protein [Mitsuaria sp. 7]|uniref:MEDS domain-containing protein n=1 Tax=Mitsuaria sp. 7 TaxID=1658665 RepID=UPI000A8D9CFE|nr:MEDS domain-containing protein [Mitsuaria sp. 7]